MHLPSSRRQCWSGRLNPRRLRLAASSRRTPPTTARRWRSFPCRTLWTLGLNNSLTAPPAFDATRGFFPLEGDQLAAYNLATGARLWVASIRTKTEPAAGDDRIFIVGAGVLTALRATDGSSAWELPFTETLTVPPVVDNGWLIAVTMTGDVLAFRATDGALIWRRNIGASAHARPALSGDRVYVPTSDSRVVTLRVDTGAPIWERRLGGAANDILASEERLYLGSQDKYLYCLNAEDGKVEWRWQTGADGHRSAGCGQSQRVLRVARQRLARTQTVERRAALEERAAAASDDRAASEPATRSSSRVRHRPCGPTTSRTGKPPARLRWPASSRHRPTSSRSSQGSFPIVIAVTRDIIKGAIVVALTRSVDPADCSVSPAAERDPDEARRAARPRRRVVRLRARRRTVSRARSVIPPTPR